MRPVSTMSSDGQARDCLFNRSMLRQRLIWLLRFGGRLLAVRLFLNDSLSRQRNCERDSRVGASTRSVVVGMMLKDAVELTESGSSEEENTVTHASSEHYRVEVFFDGDCPLCLREINALKWFDRRRHQIRFTDIADQDFDPNRVGKTMEQLMSEIHGRTPSGEWLIGVEVFRQLYSAIGLGFLVWPTRLPGISQILDAGYRLFAKNRLRLTGRCHDQCRSGVEN